MGNKDGIKNLGSQNLILATVATSLFSEGHNQLELANMQLSSKTSLPKVRKCGYDVESWTKGEAEEC